MSPNSHIPTESMDSLVRLCAHSIVTHHPLPTIPAHLYHILFQAAFLDGRPLILQDLVATWPFPELHYLQLVQHLKLHWDHPTIECHQAVIQGIVVQLQRELEEPSSDSSGCQLRILDMTGFWDDPDNGITKALAEACVEVSKHQQEFQRHRATQSNGCSGATTPPGVDVHTDLFVDETSYEIVRDALQTGATAPLRIKCHKFEPDFISASQIVTLLECVDPSCLRRVKLATCTLGQADVLEILQHLSRFPELRSLSFEYGNVFVQQQIPELANGIQSLGGQLGMLPSLRELNLLHTPVSGNLRQILGDLQAPLERLELPFCSLVPDDLAFLTQSIHAPALERLYLSGLNVSQGLLEPLQLLLEETSASLLYLDLSYCHIADSHLAVLLPTLLRCSRLRFLGLYGNPLSTAAIKDLLQKTLELPDLHEVVYPKPMDCRRLEPPYITCEERLAAAEAEFSQILVNSRRTDVIWNSSFSGNRGLDYFSL